MRKKKGKMKFDIENIAINIVKGDHGIFESKTGTSVSYPERGNDACMQIEDNSFWFKHRNNIIAESVKNFNQGRVFLI